MRAMVGIFDSGVGGLSVAAALRRLRPALPIRYLADTAYFPYGDRSEGEVTERALLMARVLVDAGCTLLIVACNTASSAALETLRATFDVPIVGMEPPLKPAVERSRTRRVAVLGTVATSTGARLARLRATYGADADVAVLPMPGLADLVEAGEVAGERVERALHEALAAPLRDGIDQVALGCTHYAFVRGPLEAIVPPGVEIIDASEPVARRAVALLAEAGDDPGPAGEAAEVVCYATGDAGRFAHSVERLRAAGAALPPLRVEPLPATAATASPGTRA
jgi:glutamate racemase